MTLVPRTPVQVVQIPEGEQGAQLGEDEPDRPFPGLGVLPLAERGDPHQTAVRRAQPAPPGGCRCYGYPKYDRIQNTGAEEPPSE